MCPRKLLETADQAVAAFTDQKLIRLKESAPVKNRILLIRLSSSAVHLSVSYQQLCTSRLVPLHSLSSC
jgi:hypothetical protein